VFLLALHLRPDHQEPQQDEHQDDGQEAEQPGIAAGGVVGKITKVADSYVSVEIATGTEIIVQRSAVQLPLPKGTIKSLQ
jgi:preprotein translocase subunit YajC